MKFLSSLSGKDLITLLGILFTLIVGLVNIYISKKRLRLENITSNRVEWINTLRKYISEFMTISDVITHVTNNNENMEMDLRQNLTKTNALIKLHLNFMGNFDKRIIHELDEATKNIYLILNLKIIMQLINRNKIASEGIRRYIEQYIYIDRDILMYLHIYFIRNNKINSTLSSSASEALSELKKTVTEEYCSVVNGTCFSDAFAKNLGSQFTSISKALDTNRNAIVKLVQIYLKAEWTRIKKEVREWPFNIYSEKKTLETLENKWETINNLKKSK